MATEKYVDGSTAGYATAFNGSDVNSLANGKAVLSSVSDIANATNLEMFADVSFQLGSVTAAAPNFISLYIYPLNSDASTYGDNQLPTPGTSATITPSGMYWVGNLMFPTGTAAIKGTITHIILPKRSFRFVIYNAAGVALASSSNTIQYSTYNRQIV